MTLTRKDPAPDPVIGHFLEFLAADATENSRSLRPVSADFLYELQ